MIKLAYLATLYKKSTNKQFELYYIINHKFQRKDHYELFLHCYDAPSNEQRPFSDAKRQNKDSFSYYQREN